MIGILRLSPLQFRLSENNSTLPADLAHHKEKLNQYSKDSRNTITLRDKAVARLTANMIASWSSD